MAALSKQLNDWAFNIKGWGVKVDVDADLPYRIVAQHAGSQSYGQTIADVSTQHKMDTLHRKDFNFQEEEKTIELPTSDDLALYLPIGVVPKNVLSQSSVIKKKITGSKKDYLTLGEHPPPMLYPFSTDELANIHNHLMWAVVRCDESVATSKIYVLVMPNEQGFCSPRVITTELVFFFSTYRTSQHSNIDSRLSSWLNAVKSVLSIYQKQDTIPEETTKQQTYRKARDTSRVVLAPRIHAVHELMVLALELEQTKDLKCLDRLETSIAKWFPDTTQRVPSPNVWLRQFVESDNLDLFDSETNIRVFINEFHQQWSNVEIDEDTKQHRDSVRILYQGRINGQLELPYSLLRGYIAEGSFVVQQTILKNGSITPTDTKFTAEDWAKVCGAVLDTVHRIQGIGPAILSYRTDQVGAILTAVLKKLQEIHKNGQQMSSTIKSRFGEEISHEPLDELWRQYAESIEQSQSKALIESITRRIIFMLQMKEDSVVDMLGDLIKILEPLKLV